MPETATLRFPALTPAWRAIVAVLLAVAWVNLPFSLVAAVVMTNPPVTPDMLVRSLLVFSVLPALAGWSLLRLFRVSLTMGDGSLHLERPGLTMVVPCSSIAEPRPWRLPLPRSGFSLVLRSGRRLAYGLCADDLDRVLDLLAQCGVEGGRARAHPSVIHARERKRQRRIVWTRVLLKYVAFAALPAAVLFYTHQHIAYGGTFGQYYLYGPSAYLWSWLVYWSVAAIYLALYASVWRGFGEIMTLAAAWLAPAHAASARRVAEAACRVAYYGGVPLLLLYRYAE